MSNYSDFFFFTKGNIGLLDCIELIHPSFPKTLRYVRNNLKEAIMLRHENGISYEYKYQAMDVIPDRVSSDLDQTFSVNIRDHEDEFVRAYRALNNNIPVTFNYRCYRDDVLSAPINARTGYFIYNVSQNDRGDVTFEAKAQPLNSVGTGIPYTLENAPLLRGIIN